MIAVPENCFNHQRSSFDLFSGYINNNTRTALASYIKNNKNKINNNTSNDNNKSQTTAKFHIHTKPKPSETASKYTFWELKSICNESLSSSSSLSTYKSEYGKSVQKWDSLLRQRRKRCTHLLVVLNPNLVNFLLFLFLCSIQHICIIYDVTSPFTFGLAQAAMSTSLDSSEVRRSAQCEYSCLSHQFQCTKSCKCIDKSRVCDGNYLDCGYKDISDEYTPECVEKRSKQSSNWHSHCNSLYQSTANELLPCFADSDPRCIGTLWWCDGKPQCNGALDEHDLLCKCDPGFEIVSGKCELSSPCKDNHILCMTEDSDSILCMHPVFQCDGERNCPRGEDESPSICNQCSPENEGGQIGISCADNTECIQDVHFCDRTIDCLNGMDEIDCEDFPNMAPIYSSQTSSATLKREMFPCESFENGQAVYWIDGLHVCDGIQQCYGGSDERNCSYPKSLPQEVGKNPGKFCTDTSCHHKCKTMDKFPHKSATAVQCSCDEGYQLASDSYTCIYSLDLQTESDKIFSVLSSGDLLEVSVDPFGNQIDKRILRSGLYKEAPVAAIPGSQVLLFFQATSADGADLVAFDLNKMTSDVIISGWVSPSIAALDYDSVHKILFWSEIAVDGNDENWWTSALKASYVDVEQVRNYGDAVEVCQNQNVTLLRSDHGFLPRGFKISSIAQNTKFGKLFISGYFSNGTGLIYILNKDGSDFRVYVDNLQKPTNLKLDARQEILYFIDGNSRKSIKRVKTHPLNYQLTHSKIVQRSDLTKRYEAPEMVRKLSSDNQQEFLSFEVLSNQIIYSEKYRGAFYTLGPISNFDPKASAFNAGFLLGAKIIQKLPKNYVAHSIVKILASAKKDNKNFGEPKKCEDSESCQARGAICLPRDAMRSKCVCPDKTIYDSIRNKCKPEILPFVVMATNANSLEKSGLHGQNKFEIATAGKVRDIYHDDTWVYWINGMSRQIERVSAALLSTASAISKIEPEVVISGLDEPYSLAVDSAGGALFWTETTRLTIEVSNLDGSYPSVLITRDKAPKFIALDLLDGLIFWTEDKSHSVWRANMDGTDVMEIVSTYSQNCLPDEIKFEPVTSQIYFSCVGIQEKKLFSASITGISSSTSDVVELAYFKGQNWCFTFYKRSIVVGRYGLRSYANHNAEIDSAIRVTTDGIIRVDVFTQENNQVLDPCERKKCLQRCLRKSTSPYYSCLCFFGFQVDPKNASNCVERKDSDILLLSHDKGIKMVFLNDNPILPGDVKLPKQSYQKRISEFDYDPKSMQLFYLQSHYKEPPEPIRRTHLLSGELQFEYAKGEDVILFTLDRIGRKIYYAEAQCQCIKVCDVDLMSPEDVAVRTKTLVSKKIGKPILGLVIDYNDGMLFWTHELGDYRVLERIDMSGAEETRCEIKGQKRTKGDFEYPAIDAVNNQIYYTFKEKIERTTFGNNGVNYFEEVVDKSNLYGVTYIKNTIYFGSHDSLSHTSVHTFSTRAVSLYPKTGNVQDQLSNAPNSNHATSSGASYYLFSQLISSQSFSVNHIHAYSYDEEHNTPEHAGSEVINHCANLNGHCEYMCLRNAQRRRTCVCADGVVLEPDGKRCKPDPQDFLLLPTERIFMPSMISDPSFTFEQIIQPYSVDFLYRRREIFIGSRQNGIFKTDFNGNNLKMVIPYIPDLENIAVDWIAENIFWTNQEGLFVSRTNGSFTKTIVSTSQNVFSRPRGLVVHPFRSLVYMTDWENKPRIIKVYMDGSGYQDIMTGTLHIRWPSSLTIDFSQDFLLWVDYSGRRIHGCFYDGTGGIKEYIERPKSTSIQSITSLNSSIFITEMFNYGALYFYNVTEFIPKEEQEYTFDTLTLHQGLAHANTDWKARSLAYVTANRQPIKSPFNGISTGGCSTMAQFQCSFLCLSNADRIQCVCPDKPTRLCTESTRKKGTQPGGTFYSNPNEISNSVGNSDSSSQTGNIIGSRLQDFELKVVMIVLVVIAVVVIILMVAILLLIRRHMIAAPPAVPPRAIFTNGDNNQSATLILTTAQPIHGHPPPCPPGTRFQNQLPPPPPFPHSHIRRPRGIFNRFNTSHSTGINAGTRTLNNQLWHSQQNDYVDMPPHTFLAGHFKNPRNGNNCVATSLKNTNLSATLSPPPYSPPSSTRLGGLNGTIGISASNRNSANNFAPFWHMSAGSTHYFRPGLLSGSPGTGNTSSDATTPRTFSENSSEDLHQHSNDDSSTA